MQGADTLGSRADSNQSPSRRCAPCSCSAAGCYMAPAVRLSLVGLHHLQAREGITVEDILVKAVTGSNHMLHNIPGYVQYQAVTVSPNHKLLV